MWLTVLTFMSLLLFLSADKSFVHFSRTARRIFWYLTSCAFGLSLVRVLQSIEGFGMMWVFVSAVLAASVVEDEVRKKMGLTTLDIDASRRLLAAYHTPEAQGKAERLMDIVAAMNKGYSYTAGTKQLLLRVLGSRERLQRALHALLESADARELNYMLCAVNAPALLEIAGRQTLDVLTGTRLRDLTTVGRAVLVDALQKLGLRYRPRRQAWARSVLLATRGAELTLLKGYLDDGGDYHTMYKLLQHDLQGGIKEEVLAHLTKEGRALVAEAALRLGVPAVPGVVLKVLSDIDDTLFSSGGAFPAGADMRYPRKCFYPGALALYAELDRCFAKRYGPALGAAQLVPPGGLPAHTGAGRQPAPPARQLLAKRSPGSLPPLGPGTGAAAAAAAAAVAATAGEDSSSSSAAAACQGGAPFLGAAAAAGGRGRAPPRVDEDEAMDGIQSQDAMQQQLEGEGDQEEEEGQEADSSEAGWDPAAPTRLSPFLLATSPGGQHWAPPGGWGGIGGEASSVPGTPRGGAPPPTPRRAQAERGIRLGGDRGPPHQEGSNLVFLSARPESYKGLTESEAYKKYFQPLLARGQLDTAPTMLLGSLDAGPRAIAKYLLGWRPPESNPATATTALYQTLAAKKMSRFREYAAIYPEACFVFVGDNGQGDVLCAEILWSSMRSPSGAPSRLLACLMHKVVPLAATYSMLRSAKGNKAMWRSDWRGRDIFFNSTHVGMAVQALALGLIDMEALHRVCAAAVADFRRIYARYCGRRSGQNLSKAHKQLNKDLAAANSCLPHHLHVPLLPPLPAAGQGLRRSGGVAAAGSDAAAASARLGAAAQALLRRPLSPARSEAAWSDISCSASEAQAS